MNKMNLNAITTNHVIRWPKLIGLMAIFGILAPLLLIAGQLFTVPSAMNYNLLSDSISSLAWANLGWLQDVSFLTAGLFIEAFAAVVLLSVRRSLGFSFGTLLLACTGFSLLLVGAFRTNIPYLLPTLDGNIHLAVSKATLILLPISKLFIAPSLRKNSFWKPLFKYTVACAAFFLVFTGAYQLWISKVIDLFGLYERLVAAAEIIWIEWMAVWLLRLAYASLKTKGNLKQETVEVSCDEKKLVQQ